MFDRNRNFLWRISNYPDLSGEGSLHASARWHTKGSRVVYLAESPGVALLETLVHLDRNQNEIPDSYTLLKISVAEGVEIDQLTPPEGSDWKRHLEPTQKIGDKWLASRHSPVAKVPSAIVPETWNFLLNPEHPDAAKISIVSVSRELFDGLLIQFEFR